MSDPNPTPTPQPQPSPRTQAPINQKEADELQLAEELLGVAKDAKYAPALKDEDIDDAFVANLSNQLKAAGDLVGGATGRRADKKSITQKEMGFHDDLLAQIQIIQKRAKRKYTNPGDPMRDKYFLGERLDGNRAQLESATRSILTILKTDTLPGMKPADVASLQTALDLYVGVQRDQTGGETDAVTAGKLLSDKVDLIAGLRRQIQYAADTVWPAGDPANAAIRTAFQIPPNRSLK